MCVNTGGVWDPRNVSYKSCIGFPRAHHCWWSSASLSASLILTSVESSQTPSSPQTVFRDSKLKYHAITLWILCISAMNCFDSILFIYSIALFPFQCKNSIFTSNSKLSFWISCWQMLRMPNFANKFVYRRYWGRVCMTRQNIACLNVFERVKVQLHEVIGCELETYWEHFSNG